MIAGIIDYILLFILGLYIGLRVGTPMLFNSGRAQPYWISVAAFILVQLAYYGLTEGPGVPRREKRSAEFASSGPPGRRPVSRRSSRGPPCSLR